MDVRGEVLGTLLRSVAVRYAGDTAKRGWEEKQNRGMPGHVLIE